MYTFQAIVFHDKPSPLTSDPSIYRIREDLYSNFMDLFTPNIDIIHSYLSDTFSLTVLSVKPEIIVTKTVVIWIEVQDDIKGM